MKTLLLIAAIINLAVAIIHTIIGESDIVAPLLATDAPDTVRWTLHAAWHMISVVLFLSALTLFYLSRKGKDDPRSMVLSRYIGIQYLALAMVFVVTSVGYGIFFPQIVMLAPIGILAILASRAASKT
ncbi:hypothetical protein [Phaeodactylibacter sp.]|jgi:small-conductance mechanosensitive channel|uniref:hypothetical protein n=1 Tax=Phaeodactylibacter sp. TaxID=1940289 RepID=UPI0025CFDB61|nr:hypothetical protein [Phaeodactylibacter sp.]MCI4647237.1 hypothetical protein [Phaeodactylibacter sp.]MCI5089591.1 hypothetical protein [Phaeodactylibacter sp.]